MRARLILSFSGNGRFKVCLFGKGKERLKMLRAYERNIEDEIFGIKLKIKKALRGVYEDTNFSLN